MVCILKKTGAAVRALHLNSNRGTLSISAPGVEYGHNAAASAFTVAATPVAGSFGTGYPTGPYPGTFNSSNTVELFSSDGPRRIFYNPNGTAITPGNILFSTNGGTISFAPGVRKHSVTINIKADMVAEADETFTVVLSNPVNAFIADNTATGTIINDDGTPLARVVSPSTVSADEQSVTISPNPAQSKVYVLLKGYIGNVTLQLQSADGKILRQEKTEITSLKFAQQLLNVSGLANGVYFIRILDNKANPKTKKLVVQR